GHYAFRFRKKITPGARPGGGRSHGDEVPLQGLRARVEGPDTGHGCWRAEVDSAGSSAIEGDHVMRSLFAVCVAASLTWAVAAADPDPPKDIQGTWSMTSAVERGKAVPAEKLKGGKFVIGKDKLTMSVGEKGDIQFSYKLNTAAKPKVIDLTQDG